MPQGLRVALLSWAVFCFSTCSVVHAGTLHLLDIAEQKDIAVNELAPRLASIGIVAMGERHGNRNDHQALQDILSAVLPHKKELALGLEMFQQSSQAELDAYIDGELDDSGLAEVFAHDWGDGFKSVLPLLQFCRDHGIPLIGLNIPREITHKIAARGFLALDEDELTELPPLTCNISPAYEDFLRSILGDHHHGSSSFTFFCEAQRVWDASFAANALNYLADNPESTVFVLCGSVHAWKPAMPSQIHERAPAVSQITILPDLPPGAKITTNDGDYVIIDEKQ